MSEYSEAPDYLPLSQLNAYAYCPRRFYYEFVLGEMLVNEHVLGGQQLHERVDLPGSMTRDEKVQFRHIYLCAPTLGLIGYCDLLETEGGRGDLPTLAVDREQQAGVHGPAIEQHGAGATVAHVADLLGARELQVVSQGVEERAPRLEQQLVLGTVHIQGDAAPARCRRYNQGR